MCATSSHSYTSSMATSLPPYASLCAMLGTLLGTWTICIKHGWKPQRLVLYCLSPPPPTIMASPDLLNPEFYLSCWPKPMVGLLAPPFNSSFFLLYLCFLSIWSSIWRGNEMKVIFVLLKGVMWVVLRWYHLHHLILDNVSWDLEHNLLITGITWNFLSSIWVL